jgi:NADH-quinone oxidoreductase subunit F
VCAFGEAEVGPIQSTLKYFRHEYEELIREAQATMPRNKEIPVLSQ